MQRKNRKSVLVVDDDEQALIFLEAYLETRGYDTTTAWSGHEALEWLQSRSFDLILLDDWLPDLSSKEILRQIEGMPIQPFVIVTQSRPSFDSGTKFSSLGVCDVVEKWMPHQISKAVQNCFESSTLGRFYGSKPSAQYQASPGRG